MRVAIFDFDGTLYAKETFQLLMDHLKSHPIHSSKYKNFYRSILPPYIGYKMKIYPEAKMKHRSMQIYIDAFNHLSDDELEVYFSEFGEEMQKDFNPDVINRLEQHIEEGLHVMLVSGAYTSLLNTATEGLHFDQIIGTEISKERSIDHVAGTKKNEKIKEALKGKDIDWDSSYAYGDSLSDLSVLELVGHPVAVRPDSRLQKIAEEREWEII